MHILHFNPTKNFTLIEQNILELASFQKTQGHNINMVTFPKTDFEQICLRRGLGTVSFNIDHTVEHFKFWNAFSKLVADKKIDILHIHSTVEISRFQQLKQLQKLCGANIPKTILHIHYSGAQTRKDNWQWVLHSGISEYWCGSQTAKTALSQVLPVDPAQLFVFKYAKDIEQEKNYLTKDEARANLSLPKDALVFGNVGGIEKSRGIEEFVRATAELMGKNPKIHLVQMGAVSAQNSEAQNYYNFITEWISFLRPDVKNRFHFLGAKFDAYKYLKAFDISVSLGVDDFFPFMILDALLGSLPVIAAKSGVAPELVINNETGLLCEPENVVSLQECLEKILALPDLGKQLGSFACEKVKNEYNQKTIFEAMLKQYSVS